MNNSKRWLLAGSATLAIIVAHPALAQQQPAPAAPAAATADAGSTLIEAVVVTAEKRSQNLQDVPVAVSAFSDKARDNVGIQNVQDLTNFTPGMQYTTGNDRVSLRGISRFTNNRSSEGGVAIYIDGTYTSSTTPGNLSTLFIDRTEVLRGPQGTLYGRNSVGGAVNFISKRPKDTFGGEIRAGVENYDYYDVEGAVTGPITDHIRYRLAGDWSSRGRGYFKDVNPTGSTSAVKPGYTEGNRGDQGVIEGQLAGDAFDGHLDWWVKAQFVNWEGFGRGPGGRNSYSTGVYETFPLIPTGLVPSPTFGYTGTRPANRDPRLIDIDTPNYISLNYHNYIAETTWHAPAFDIKYTGGYSFYDYNLQSDVDGTSNSAGYTLTPTTVIRPTGTTTASAFLAPGQTVTVLPRQVNAYQEEPWWYSNELNFTSSGKGPTQWIFGLYQFREGSNYKGVDARMPDQPQFSQPSLFTTDANHNPTGFAFNGGAPNPLNQYALNRSDNVTWSEAVFGQVSQKLGDKFTLTGGLRYSWDRRKSAEQVRYVCWLSTSCPVAQGVFPTVDMANLGAVLSYNSTDPSIVGQTTYDPATGLATRYLKNSWEALTGTVKLDYKPDEDSLYYASYTRGYKAGGFNAGTITANPSTNPEFINAYEVGMKRTFGTRLQANASAFWYDYTDVQVPLSEISQAGISITNFYNLPKTTSRGFELETIYFPTDRLQLLINYAYLDAKINKACCFVDPQDPTALQAGAAPVTTAANGSRGQDLSGELFPNSTPHRVTLNGEYRWDLFGGTLTGSMSYIWRSATYSSQFNRWYNKVPSWGQTDARLIWRGGGKYTLIGYVKNLFDEQGPVSASATRANLPPANPATQPYDILSQSFTINQPRTFGFEIQKKF